ncbi:MAG TPA: endonuclease III [Clostridia bacterium]|jgi:endonuclease-3|nr:endonuclease III [Clostridia bacterium]
MESGGNEKERINRILESLEQQYEGRTTALKYSNPFELLIAVILSAQTTDKQVNKVTEKLFQELSTPEDFAKLTPEQLEQKIKGVGLAKSKSRNIIETCQMLVKEYNSQVPQKKEDLLRLPGVGQKTANVVISIAFGEPALAVDTHVFRLAKRLGLSKGKNVLQTEEDLMALLPKTKWASAHHWFIWHGREVCTARNPKCSLCKLSLYCPYYQENSALAGGLKTD